MSHKECVNKVNVTWQVDFFCKILLSDWSQANEHPWSRHLLFLTNWGRPLIHTCWGSALQCIPNQLAWKVAPKTQPRDPGRGGEERRRKRTAMDSAGRRDWISLPVERIYERGCIRPQHMAKVGERELESQWGNLAGAHGSLVWSIRESGAPQVWARLSPVSMSYYNSRAILCWKMCACMKSQ